MAKQTKYQTRSTRILGIDPGIAHTGLSVVCHAKQNYRLLETELVKTAAADKTGKRLDLIHAELCRLLDKHSVDGIAIEAVYHNKNITSSISTGKVIGLCELTAYTYELPVMLLTPQQVKAASGFGGSANKRELWKMAQRIFGAPVKSHHVADAAFCALAGCLLFRSTPPNMSPGLERPTRDPRSAQRY